MISRYDCVKLNRKRQINYRVNDIEFDTIYSLCPKLQINKMIHDQALKAFKLSCPYYNIDIKVIQNEELWLKHITKISHIRLP